MFSCSRLAASFTILLTGGLIAGCVPRDNASYPTLAPRPIEARFNTPPAEPVPAAPVAASADDTQRLAQLTAEIADARAAFEAARPDVVRRLDTVPDTLRGSDSWAAAVQALSRLDVLRSRTSDAVASLGDLGLKLAQNSASAGTPAALQQQVDAAIDQGQTEAKRQADIISSLSNRLSR